tara:strand:+ start:47 stop:502 length:456 start_codon:yes stop_codon:yes gene_type:complete
MAYRHMDTTRNIQALAKVQLILIVVYVVSSILLESLLPPLLQEYLNNEFERESTSFENVIFGVGLLALLVYLAALWGIIKVEVWAKNGYIYSTIVLFICSLGLGPIVDHVFAAGVSYLGAVVTGMLIALLLCTESAFNKKGLGTALQPPQP